MTSWCVCVLGTSTLVVAPVDKRRRVWRPVRWCKVEDGSWCCVRDGGTAYGGSAAKQSITVGQAYCVSAMDR